LPDDLFLPGMNLSACTGRFQRRFQELEDLLSAPDLYADPRRAQELIREHNRIKQALADAHALEQARRHLAENQTLASDPDPEIAAIATAEIPALEASIRDLEQRVLAAIVPPDPHDSRNTIVEIRAGTGGDEAALFAADLFRMYARYAERNNWTLEVADSSPAELGGYKEIIFNLTGQDVFRKMRYESGVHRVQRVPATENQGRIHTSTATVAVLPEAEEVDVVIKPDEIRVEVCRSGGPGGQGVNTTDSAVQILHIPTGLIVRCQDGRSQLKNREKAMQVLRTRLYEAKASEEQARYAAHRKQQVGTGERNERIRTYNYPQSRLTDHRVGYTTHNLSGVLDGDLSDLFNALFQADLVEKLKTLEPGLLPP
jgi:peptide chain release factor 1